MTGGSHKTERHPETKRSFTSPSPPPAPVARPVGFKRQTPSSSIRGGLCKLNSVTSFLWAQIGVNRNEVINDSKVILKLTVTLR